MPSGSKRRSKIRPIYHWLADRVRAHAFVCMLAYYLEWHMRQRLAPMLYDDTDNDRSNSPILRSICCTRTAMICGATPIKEWKEPRRKVLDDAGSPPKRSSRRGLALA